MLFGLYFVGSFFWMLKGNRGLERTSQEEEWFYHVL